ncbi:MAG: DUF433 domain-containing protein [Pyrinomonadaceae bacterium]
MIDWRRHIHSDEAVLTGKPVIKNTRISVELILELLEIGWTEEMILESYPKLTAVDLKAVFAYLRECVQQELYFPFLGH